MKTNPNHQHPINEKTRISFFLARPWQKGEDNHLIMEIEGLEAPKKARMPLNLAFAIDKSGSMCEPAGHGSQTKMQAVIEACCLGVQSLEPTDSVSLVSFNGQVEVLLASTPVGNKEHLLKTLRGIGAHGSTNLYEGWRVAGVEVAKVLDSKKLNRVILFSDGEATDGKTNTQEIAAKVKGLFANLISTSTFGVGARYNEDLMQKMAIEGGGSYYYIKDPSACVSMFLQEFSDMQRLIGTDAILSLDGIKILEQLNQLPEEKSFYKLPPLLHGNTIKLAFKLKAESTSMSFDFRYQKEGWQKFTGQVELSELPIHEKAESFLAELQVAIEKKKAMAALDANDVFTAKSLLRAASAYSMTHGLVAESVQLNSMVGMADTDRVGLRKSALFQSYNAQYSRSSSKDEHQAGADDNQPAQGSSSTNP